GNPVAVVCARQAAVTTKSNAVVNIDRRANSMSTSGAGLSSNAETPDFGKRFIRLYVEGASVTGLVCERRIFTRDEGSRQFSPTLGQHRKNWPIGVCHSILPGQFE